MEFKSHEDSSKAKRRKRIDNDDFETVAVPSEVEGTSSEQEWIQDKGRVVRKQAGGKKSGKHDEGTVQGSNLSLPESVESWELVEEVVEEARRKFHPIITRSSISVATYNKQVSERYRLPNAAVTRKKIYGCSHGNKRKKRSFGARETSTRYIGCPFSFSAVARPTLIANAGKPWTIQIMIKNDGHNHELSRLHHMAMAENRKIPTMDDVAISMRTQGTNAMTRTVLQEKYGKFITAKDYQNMKASVAAAEKDGRSEEELLRAFGQEFKSRNERNVFSIIVDQATRARSVIVQSHWDRDIFAGNPQVLLMDATHCINQQGYNCFGVMSMDCFGHGQLVQTALISDGYADNLESVLEIFKRNNSRWKEVKVVVVDKDMTEINVIRSCLPGVDVTLCQFHVIKWFKTVLPGMEIRGERKHRVLEKVQRMMYARKEDEYIKIREDLLNEFGREHEFALYFVKNWDSCAKMWCCFHRNVIPHLGNTTNNRLESHWHKLKQVLNRNLPMTECLQKMVSMQHQWVQEFAISLVSRKMRSSDGFQGTNFFDLIINDISSFVRKLLFEEYRRYTIQDSMRWSKKQEKGSIVVIVNDDIIDGQSYTIEIRENGYLQCTCRFSSVYELPCRHCFDVILPRQIKAFHLHPRWICSNFRLTQPGDSTFAYPDIVLLPSSTPLAETTNLESREKYNILANTLKDVAEFSMEEFKRHLHVLEFWKKLRQKGDEAEAYCMLEAVANGLNKTQAKSIEMTDPDEEPAPRSKSIVPLIPYNKPGPEESPPGSPTELDHGPKTVITSVPGLGDPDARDDFDEAVAAPPTNGKTVDDVIVEVHAISRIDEISDQVPADANVNVCKHASAIDNDSVIQVENVLGDHESVEKDTAADQKDYGCEKVKTGERIDDQDKPNAIPSDESTRQTNLLVPDTSSSVLIDVAQQNASPKTKDLTDKHDSEVKEENLFTIVTDTKRPGRRKASRTQRRYSTRRKNLRSPKNLISVLPVGINDYKRLSPGRWYNDILVYNLTNAFVSKYSPPFQLVDPVDFFMAYGGKTQTKLVNDTYLVISHCYQIHWTLLVVKLQPKGAKPGIYIFHANSRNQSDMESQVTKSTKAYLSRKYHAKDIKLTTYYHSIPCQQQTNMDDCGVHCVRNIDLLSQIPRRTFALTADTFVKHFAKALSTQDDMIQIREKFKNIIYNIAS